MAKPKATRADILPPPVAEQPEQESAPVPGNRAIRPGMVRVRANSHIVEWPNGERVYIAQGEEGELEADRAVSLGSLVTIL